MGACIESESSKENPHLQEVQEGQSLQGANKNDDTGEIFLHPNRTPTSRNNSGSSSNSISQTSQSKNQTFQQKQKQKIYPDSNVLFDSRLLDTPTSSPISSQENNNETKSSDDSVVRRRQSSRKQRDRTYPLGRKVQKQYLSSKG